jgi:hypothetical protein
LNKEYVFGEREGFREDLYQICIRIECEHMYWGRREATERIYVMGRRVAPERICISFE